MKRTKDSLRDLWDNIKGTNIWIIGVPEEEEKKKGYEKIFEEIIVENFPSMEKKIVNQVQEAQRVPYMINSRRNTPKHILIKLTKTKHKERIREKFWRDYRWKFPQYGKGNSRSSSRGTKSPIQDKPKEKHTKTHTNQTKQRLNTKKEY